MQAIVIRGSVIVFLILIGYVLYNDYKATYGFLPATSKPMLLKDALYPFASPSKDAGFTISDPSMWYYHCPPSSWGELSTLTLKAPVLNDRDIDIVINWHKRLTGWQYEIISQEGKKYLVMKTKAVCKNVKK